jgi:hypothetical protein
MYGRGGWVFVPDHELPTRKLTAKQKRENEAAWRAWDKKCKAIRAIAKRANAAAEEFGGYIPHDDDDDEYGGGPSYPELKLPHPEGQLATERFTEADEAVYEYTGGVTRRWESMRPGELKALRRVVDAGVKVHVSFQGMSAGSFPVRLDDFKRDGPPVPDFINDNWWRK